MVTAVESYEYSKMHMNMVANQTTAGLSLVNGPVLATRSETTPFARLVARAAELFTNAGTDLAGYAQLPPPSNNSQNYLGFAGLWPAFAAFDSFDPTMLPSPDVVKSCTFSGGYGGIPTLGVGAAGVRVRLQLAPLAEPRRPGRQDARPCGARVRDVEGGALVDRLRRAPP